jgi:hypothetical protein
VLPGRVPGDSREDIYAALQSTWRDPSTGVIHGWYHAEVSASTGPGCGATYASIGHATSVDNGDHFIKRGTVLTSPYPKDLTVCQGQGVQGPKVLDAGDHLYMFFTVTHTGETARGGVGLARASKHSPGEWQHYANGRFDQPGIGGDITPVLPRGGANGDLWGASVSWNTYLRQYLMLHTDYNHEGAIFIRTSDNLLSWSNAFLLMRRSGHAGYRYPTLLGIDDDVTLERGWLYLGRTPRGGRTGPDTLMVRRSFSLLSIRRAE